MIVFVRVIFITFVIAMVLIILGIAFDLSGDVVVPLLLVLQCGITFWGVWAMRKPLALR